MKDWHDIPWYEWIYQINKSWEIYSLPSKMWHNWMKRKTLKHKNWYVYILLQKDWKKSNIRLHRLIAQIFIPNPYKKEYVNHINWIKDDNRIENLEWCTASENMQHAYKEWLINVSKGKNHYNYWKFWKKHHNAKKIDQFTLDWEFIKTWDSWVDIRDELWLNKWNIVSVCKWKRNQTWWFKWKYHKES